MNRLTNTKCLIGCPAALQLDERLYAQRDSLVGLALAPSSPLRTVPVTFQGRPYVGAYTTGATAGCEPNERCC